MLSIHCPNCGGTNIFDETRFIPTYCAFCGAHLPDMTQFVKDSLKININQQQLNLDRQRHEMDMERIDREARRAAAPDGTTLIKSIVALCMFGLLFYILIKFA